jgi:hypothetical protein
MTAKQVVEILAEVYQKSDYAAATMSRIQLQTAKTVHISLLVLTQSVQLQQLLWSTTHPAGIRSKPLCNNWVVRFGFFLSLPDLTSIDTGG